VSYDDALSITPWRSPRFGWRFMRVLIGAQRATRVDDVSPLSVCPLRSRDILFADFELPRAHARVITQRRHDTQRHTI